MAAVAQPVVMKSNDIIKHLYTELFEPILARFGVPKEERKYRMSFYLNGISAVIIEWVKNGCREETESIANILMNCLGV